MLDGYVEVGLERGLGFEVNRQVVGAVTLDDMGSVFRIGDVEAIDRVRGTNDRVSGPVNAWPPGAL